jgi:hypothetical protein
MEPLISITKSEDFAWSMVNASADDEKKPYLFTLRVPELDLIHTRANGAVLPYTYKGSTFKLFYSDRTERHRFGDPGIESFLLFKADPDEISYRLLGEGDAPAFYPGSIQIEELARKLGRSIQRLYSQRRKGSTMPLEQETSIALSQFDKYFALHGLRSGAGASEMREMLIAVDLGRRLGKSKLWDLRDKLTLDAEHLQAVLALVSRDPLRRFMTADAISEGEVTKTADAIGEMAAGSGMKIAAFFRLLTSLSQIDMARNTRDGGARPDCDAIFEWAKGRLVTDKSLARLRFTPDREERFALLSAEILRRADSRAAGDSSST